MKLKGIVHIQIVELDVIKYEVIQENLIPDASWLGILGNNAVTGYFNRRISIAQDASTPVASVSTVSNVIGTCATPTGVTSPVFIENLDPPFGQITGQISPTGVERTFTSVALTALNPANTQSVASTTAFARLLLDIPCTQGVNDFINITYSIQFLDNVGDGLPNKTLNRYDLGRALFNLGNYRMGNIYYSFSSPYSEAIALPPVGVADTTTGAINAANFKWNYTKTLGKNDQLGVIINAIPQGLSNNNLEAYSLGFYEYDREPIQTGFKHGANSTIPLFDSVNLASSQGGVLHSGTWTGKLPEFYKLTFTASGATGVATYKFSVFKHIGFNGNAYSFRDQSLLYLRPDIKYAENLHGWKEEDFDKHRLSNSEVVQFDVTGVSIVDIVTGENTNFDASSTPALPTTNIRQIAVDTTNRLIYVACRNTGLHIINFADSIVSNPLTNPCYGVDVGRNNIAVAIVNGGIYRSNDWSTALTFSYTDISNDWSRVHFLKADSEHANDRIAIVAQNPANTANRIVWHQFSNNTTTTGYENAVVQPYPASLDVSDTGSFWVFYNGGTANNSFVTLSFASATLGTGYRPFYKLLTHSVYGTKTFSKISFYENNLFASISVGNSSSGVLYGGTLDGFVIGAIPGRANFPAESFSTLAIIHIDSGITLIFGNDVQGNNFARQIFPNGNANLITNYGWNGSSWVKDNPNSKTTHADAQPLLNGLTVRFVDGANPPHFVANEFQTNGVNYGILKDNATDLVWRSAWYSKTTHYDDIAPTVITSTVTLPAQADPFFRRMDTDPVAIPHRFFIDAVAVTKIWTDGTAPAVTEVSINANAEIAFNAADADKTLTGKYVWIEV